MLSHLTEYPFPCANETTEEVQERKLEPKAPVYRPIQMDDLNESPLLPDYEDSIAPAPPAYSAEPKPSGFNVASGWGKCCTELIKEHKDLSGYAAVMKKEYLTRMKDAGFRCELLHPRKPILDEDDEDETPFAPPPFHLDPSKTSLLRARKKLCDASIVDAPSSSAAAGEESRSQIGGASKRSTATLPSAKRRKTNDLERAPSAVIPREPAFASGNVEYSSNFPNLPRPPHVERSLLTTAEQRQVEETMKAPSGEPNQPEVQQVERQHPPPPSRPPPPPPASAPAYPIQIIFKRPTLPVTESDRDRQYAMYLETRFPSGQRGGLFGGL